MLGNKPIINIDDKYKIRFTYRTLKNIYDMTNINPLTYIRDFFKAENKEKYLGKLIFALSDGEISIADTYTKYLKDDNGKLIMILNLVNLIDNELINEYQEIKEDDENVEVENNILNVSQKEDLQNWISYWNQCYSIATVILHKSEDEFLDMSPREFKTLDSYINNYYKSVLIGAYIDVIKAQGKADKEKVEEEPYEEIRLSRLFSSM